MAKVTLSSTGGQYKASPAKIWAAMIAVYIVWGSTYLAIRFAVETMPPFLMAATRFFIAGGLLFIVRRLAGDPVPTRFEWRGAAIMGLFLLVGGNGGVSWAEQYVPSGLTALMVASAPIWMLLLEAVLPGGRRPGWRAVAGIVVGFVGIALLFWPGEGSLLNIHLGGALALLLAALSWSFGSIFSRNLRLPPSPMMGTAAEMLTGSLGLLLLAAVSGDFSRLDFAAISRESLLGLGYLVVFGALVGFTAYTWLLRVAPTSLVSTYAYVNPLVALVLGVVIGAEILSPRALLAAVVILSSVALTTSGRAAAQPVEETAGPEIPPSPEKPASKRTAE